MRVLFDQGTPAPLRHLFLGHVVSTAFEVDWATLKNGELLTAAENQGFEIAIVVLGTTSWPRIKAAPELIVGAVNNCIAGSYIEITIP
jgi:hypothetical protein